MKLTETFKYMGVHSRKEMIDKFLEFQSDILIVRNNYIYCNGLLNEIKNIYFEYPYTVMIIDFYPKKKRY